MRHFLTKIIAAILLVTALACYGYAQGGGASSSLIGTVVDQSGGVIPGADVLVKNDATGAEFKTITNENGLFTIPALDPGVYTATVSMPNFKTSQHRSLVLVSGTPYSLKVALQIGGSNEVVTVMSGLEVLQTQSAAIATTMVINQIANLPLATRNAMDFLVMLPGVNTTGGARDSTISGMPETAINITIDGVNTQDNYLKNGDGFFSYISPRLDAIQEVTVSTATPGAESSGTGAVQIRFITRSGNNEFHGSGYWYHRNPALNSNYWFRNRDLTPVYKGDPGGGLQCTRSRWRRNSTSARRRATVCCLTSRAAASAVPLFFPRPCLARWASMAATGRSSSSTMKSSACPRNGPDPGRSRRLW